MPGSSDRSQGQEQQPKSISWGRGSILAEAPAELSGNSPQSYQRVEAALSSTASLAHTAKASGAEWMYLGPQGSSGFSEPCPGVF